jgi:hypothetical protein
MKKNKLSVFLALLMFALLGLFSGVSAVGTHADLDSSKDPLDFGEVDVDDTKSKSLIITNEHATDSLTITDVDISGSDRTEFDIDNDNEDCDGATLAAGETCEITIIFEPTDELTYNDAVLEITVSGDTTAFEVDLEGVGGTGSADTNVDVTISDETIDFEDTMVDYVSMKSFDITNSGTDSFLIEDIGLYGDDDEHFDVYDRDCLDVTLAADKSCTMLVFFEPDTTGIMLSEIEILIDGEPDEFIVEMEGEAITASSDVNVSPIRKDFGVAEKGDKKSITFTVDVSNTSIGIDTALTGSADFEIDDDDCDGKDIGSAEDNDECDIVINYTSSEGGFVYGVLEINADTEDFFVPVYAFVEGVEDYPDDILGDTFEDYIERLLDAGVVSGYTDGTYKPQELVTRGQLAKFIFNAFDIVENTSCDAFLDVTTTDSFYKEITSLKCAEIISGYPDGTYKPNDSVTRGQVTKFITEALKEKGITVDMDKVETFPDVDETDTFVGYIAYLSSLLFEGQKVIGGYSDGEFKSARILTRGEMSKMIDISMRYYESL